LTTTCSKERTSNIKKTHLKKTHLEQHARVPKHGRMLFLFDPVIGLVELWRHFIEAKKQHHKRELTSSVTLCKCTFSTCKCYACSKENCSSYVIIQD
jgi:hypothetical protein